MHAWMILALVMLGTPSVVQAQDAPERLQQLEARVDALEQNLDQMDKNLREFADNLVKHVDQRMALENGKTVVLNPVSKEFAKIETNAGQFLVAVYKMQRQESSYRLQLQIGNPNAASFKGVHLKMRWGKKWDASMANVPHEKWRDSLTVGEFDYEGALPSGEWTDVFVDLVPAGVNQLEHIECEMVVKSAELKMREQ